MTDLFQNGRPDDWRLTAGFGVRPPALFVRFAEWVYDRCGGDAGAADTLYSQITGLD